MNIDNATDATQRGAADAQAQRQGLKNQQSAGKSEASDMDLSSQQQSTQQQKSQQELSGMGAKVQSGKGKKKSQKQAAQQQGQSHRSADYLTTLPGQPLSEEEFISSKVQDPSDTFTSNQHLMSEQRKEQHKQDQRRAEQSTLPQALYDESSLQPSSVDPLPDVLSEKQHESDFPAEKPQQQGPQQLSQLQEPSAFHQGQRDQPIDSPSGITTTMNTKTQVEGDPAGGFQKVTKPADQIQGEQYHQHGGANASQGQHGQQGGHQQQQGKQQQKGQGKQQQQQMSGKSSSTSSKGQESQNASSIGGQGKQQQQMSGKSSSASSASSKGQESQNVSSSSGKSDFPQAPISSQQQGSNQSGKSSSNNNKSNKNNKSSKSQQQDSSSISTTSSSGQQQQEFKKGDVEQEQKPWRVLHDQPFESKQAEILGREWKGVDLGQDYHQQFPEGTHIPAEHQEKTIHQGQSNPQSGQRQQSSSNSSSSSNKDQKLSSDSQDHMKTDSGQMHHDECRRMDDEGGLPGGHDQKSSSFGSKQTGPKV